MPDQLHESLVAVRVEKLDRIANLGVDPWGQRLRGTRQSLPRVPATDLARDAGGEQPGPTVRVAGRIMLRRGQGKGRLPRDLRDWTDHSQIFVGKKQVGSLGWAG
jgi:lysyl-tRNA synthetase class 2